MAKTVCFDIDESLYQIFLRQCAEYGNSPDDVLREMVKHAVEIEEEREATDFWQHQRTKSRSH